MTSQSLQVKKDGRGVCTVTLDRPRRANALDGELVDNLMATLDGLQTDSAVRVLVLTGQGEFFSSGADLGWMETMASADVDTNLADARALAHLLETVAGLKLPTVARINGPAYGGALGLIAACDIAIANAAAVFAFSEVRLGLIPAVATPYLVAAVGARTTRHWILSGAEFDAETALLHGLVHRVATPRELDRVVQEEVDYLLAGCPSALEESKELLNKWLPQHAVTTESSAPILARRRASREGREGVRAFLERRKPEWS